MSDEDYNITTDMIEVTRRIKSKNPVSNRDIWEREYRLIVFKFFPGNAEPPLPPTLRYTDTEQYYCIKRSAADMLGELMATGLTLEQALQEKCRYFLERPGGTEQYDQVDFVSKDCAVCIEALLTAYEAMVSK